MIDCSGQLLASYAVWLYSRLVRWTLTGAGHVERGSPGRLSNGDGSATDIAAFDAEMLPWDQSVWAGHSQESILDGFFGGQRIPGTTEHGQSTEGCVPRVLLGSLHESGQVAGQGHSAPTPATKPGGVLRTEVEHSIKSESQFGNIETLLNLPMNACK